jgi:Mg-chelatase subunit ChlD
MEKGVSILDPEARRRWRLVLGADSQSELGELTAIDQQREQALDYLYRREYGQRGYVASYDEELGRDHSGSRAPTSPTPAHWLAGVRQVFPRSVVNLLQRQAIERYQLTSLLTDPEVMRQATPNIELVQTLLSFRSHLSDEVMEEVRHIIRTVCDELEAVLAQRVRSRLGGRGPRHRHGGRPCLTNLDWPATLRHNLKHYDLEQQLPVLERLFFTRNRRQREVWELFLLVDQSGSMTDAIIHSAVLAGIFCSVRTLRPHLILFDTEVVDLTGQLSDPVETLLAVQLGGGTDIAKALSYAAGCISQPGRSMVVLISDFEECGDPEPMFAQVEQLRDTGATLLGLAALDDTVIPAYNESNARRLTSLGMDIGIMTPEHLAEWVASCLVDAN